MRFSFLFYLAKLHILIPTQGSQTKEFELNLAWESRASDGVERPQALINGQFPGPPLILDEGDSVEVVVNNLMPFDTTVHFHGIECDPRT